MLALALALLLPRFFLFLFLLFSVFIFLFLLYSLSLSLSFYRSFCLCFVSFSSLFVLSFYFSPSTAHEVTNRRRPRVCFGSTRRKSAEGSNFRETWLFHEGWLLKTGFGPMNSVASQVGAGNAACRTRGTVRIEFYTVVSNRTEQKPHRALVSLSFLRLFPSRPPLWRNRPLLRPSWPAAGLDHSQPLLPEFVKSTSGLPTKPALAALVCHPGKCAQRRSPRLRASSRLRGTGHSRGWLW